MALPALKINQNLTSSQKNSENYSNYVITKEFDSYWNALKTSTTSQLLTKEAIKNFGLVILSRDYSNCKHGLCRSGFIIFYSKKYNIEFAKECICRLEKNRNDN